MRDCDGAGACPYLLIRQPAPSNALHDPMPNPRRYGGRSEKDLVLSDVWQQHGWDLFFPGNRNSFNFHSRDQARGRPNRESLVNLSLVNLIKS